MTQLTVTATGTFRTLPAEAWRTQALALVPLLDEWTQAPPPVVFARSLSPHVYAHVTRGTLVLTGRPEQAWPQLATTAQFVTVSLLRPGHAEQRVTIRVPAASPLPFTAAGLAVASTAIAAAGRVTAAAFPHAPIAAATLQFAGAPAAPLVALDVPLSAAHASGCTVQLRTLTSAGTTTLTGLAVAGATTLTLASTAGVAAGRVLLLGTGEHTVVDAVRGQVVLLRLPLRTSQASGSTVTRRNLGGVGAATTLSRDALAGDGVLPVAAALAGTLVELVDGPGTEYRSVGLGTDADGRWRLSGVRGIPELRITTAAPGFLTDGPRTHPLAPTDPYVIDTALKI